MKALANKGVYVFVGISFALCLYLSGCSSHDKSVLKSDYDQDSIRIRKLVESQARGNDPVLKPRRRLILPPQNMNDLATFISAKGTPDAARAPATCGNVTGVAVDFGASSQCRARTRQDAGVRRKPKKTRGRVLLVEDDELNLELVQTVLEGAGFEVLSATAGAAGIEQARHAAPDVILMDVQMPGMDGLEATRVLQADATTAGFPVIAVTAHVKKEDERRCLDAGCVLHLSKPVDTRALPDIVERVIAAARERVP